MSRPCSPRGVPTPISCRISRPKLNPLDADRRRTFFRKAGAVEDQHAPAFREHGSQAPPHALRIPGRMGNEVLEGLVADRFGDPGQHRLHRFPLAVAEDALNIRPQRQQLRAMAKAALELLEPSNQSLHARRRGVIDQCATGYRN